MVFLCCFGRKMEEPRTEYDELPFSLRWRMNFGKYERDPHTGVDIMRLSNNRLLQTHCESTEYQALKVVDKHTAIPAYRVINIYHRPEGKVVEYEATPGKNLEQHWTELSLDKKRRIISDLGRFVDQLRKMTPPKHFVIGDSTMGAALNTRFGPGKVGPFYTIDAFHDFLRRGHRPQEFRGDCVVKVHEVRARSNKPYQLKFTHGNLIPRNVLIDDAGRVCSLIGWESAGWYPEYWEYVQMCQNTDLRTCAGEEWLEMMKATVPRYDDELECDCAIRSRFKKGGLRTTEKRTAAESIPSMLRLEQEEIDEKNTENTSG